MPDAMPAVLKNGGVLIEPWTFMDMADRTAAERAKAVLQSPRIFPDSAKMGSAPLTVAEELEITFQWMLWMVACVLPLLSLAWLLVWPSLAAGAVAAAVAVSMLWRSGEWPVPPPRRLQCIVRNRKIASVFMRYHPLRLIVEAPEELLSESGSRTTRLFAGVPHGLFPIGFVLLGFCNFCMPWRRVRAAAASVTLRLPLWRQVALWNGGIDVSRGSIVAALRAGDHVMVAMDGIAGMFVGRKWRAREVYLLRRRKGLVRIALQTGAPLVPVVCFGNTRAVVPLTDPLGAMEALSRWLGISLIYPGGRFLLPVPKRVPITVVIGEALALPPAAAANAGPPAAGEVVEPSEQMIDELHERLIKAHAALYYRWRAACGYADVELEVV